jgi:hypothetical protein
MYMYIREEGNIKVDGMKWSYELPSFVLILILILIFILAIALPLPFQRQTPSPTMRDRKMGVFP